MRLSEGSADLSKGGARLMLGPISLGPLLSLGGILFALIGRRHLF